MVAFSFTQSFLPYQCINSSWRSVFLLLLLKMQNMNHPNASTLSLQVVIYEIGWLDFYAAFSYICNQKRRKSKKHPIQAEKEIILTTVFTVCYDVFSGFAHFSRSTPLLIDTNLLEFLLRRLPTSSDLSFRALFVRIS